MDSFCSPFHADSGGATYFYLCWRKNRFLGIGPPSGQCPIALTTYMMICVFVHSHTLCARELKICGTRSPDRTPPADEVSFSRNFAFARDVTRRDVTRSRIRSRHLRHALQLPRPYTLAQCYETCCGRSPDMSRPAHQVLSTCICTCGLGVLRPLPVGASCATPSDATPTRLGAEGWNSVWT